MINYFFDGSFEGFLTAVYEAYYRRENPKNILHTKNMQESFLDKNVRIFTEPEKAEKVYNSICQKISYNALKNIYHAFLSELDGISTPIFEYIKLGFKVGSKVDLFLSDDKVLKVHTTAGKVRHETHGMLGLIRFKKLSDNLYYAPYNPLYNITPLVCPHFSKRLSDQNWIIHDVERNYAGVYDMKECYFIDLPSEYQFQANHSGDMFESLWKQYFKSICIKDRINPNLQRRNMPKRYWKYLTEKQLQADG